MVMGKVAGSGREQGGRQPAPPLGASPRPSLKPRAGQPGQEAGGQEAGLTCGRRWPRSGRTDCAGCSAWTGTGGWRRRWWLPGGLRPPLLEEGVVPWGSLPAPLSPGVPVSAGWVLSPPAPGHRCRVLTWQVGRVLQLVVRAAILGTLHEVGRLIHVLQGDGRWAHALAGSAEPPRSGSHLQSTCHRRAPGHGTRPPCPATSPGLRGW